MASLTAAPVVFSSLGVAPEPVHMRCDLADTFFRGALVFWLGGQVTPIVTDTTTEFAGVVAEHTVTTALNQFVLVYIKGIFLFANTNFTIANQGSLFYQTTAGEDDPSTLNVSAAGDSGACGRLVQCKTTAVDGFLDIGDRFDHSETA